jgi:hypothetical protein
MAITPDQYEKLGVFYLGRELEPETKAPKEDLILYKSKDLVTHGVVLGMTGSGKTGLCLALLEEAAMDNIPALIIDPKGDIGNIMLTFPELRGEDFRPWINEDDAVRKNMEPDAFAQAQADMWKKGLGDWGQPPERIKNLRDKVSIRIYTPGSSSGIPLSILSSLNVPSAKVLGNDELLNDRVVNTVSSILGLLGDKKDPQESKEHAFLCAIFNHCWSNNQNVDMQTLIRLILRPPFEKIGVFSVDEFLPQNDRDTLAKNLNNLVASPNFKSWLEGCPLDIPSLLQTTEGKPQVAILSIAHLNDQERMFFVTLVLNELTAWMRIQSGTTSLRALFYMDEIFGYLPPVANPPSKRPMLLLLKQARAFGLGLLLATQNPVDLDYKALSNIGTWWLGRLQTQRDKDRVLDGLESAAGQAGHGFNRKRLDQLLSELGTRIFLMNNVNNDAPILMEVRWVMSYLRGPLSRDQIEILMNPIRREVEDQMIKASELTGTKKIIPRPVVPNGVEEIFLPVTERGAKVYEPHLLRCATYIVASGETRKQTEINQIVPFTRKGDLDIDKATELPCRIGDFEAMPEEDIEFDDVPKTITRSFMSDAKADFTNDIYTNHGLSIWSVDHPKIKEKSNPGESEADFRTRLQANLDSLRAPLETKLINDHEKWTVEKWTPAYEKAKAASKKRWWVWLKKIFKPLLVIVGFVISLVLKTKKGGRDLTSTVLAEAGSGGFSEAKKAAGSIASSSPDQIRPGSGVKELEAQQEAREEKLKLDLQRLAEEYQTANLRLKEEVIRPYKKDIEVRQIGLAWVAR